MSLLTDFFVAAVATAQLYGPMQAEDSVAADRYLASIERAQHKNLTGLEISSLWAVVEGVPLNLDRHSLLTLPMHEGDEYIVEEFPPRLAELLAGLREEELPRNWPPSGAKWKSSGPDRSIFYWLCRTSDA